MRAEAAPSFLWTESIPAAGERLTLGAEDAHYLARVCRARAGEQVTLTDGHGVRARALLVEIGRRPLAEVLEVERLEPGRGALLLCGAPERGRADWMVEKLAELGVSTLQPVHCERAPWSPAEVRLARWRRLAVAALRQSLGCFLLEVRAPIRLDDALAGLPAGGSRYLAEPAGSVAGSLSAPVLGTVFGLVGPAPGLAEGERAVASAAGFQPIALSGNRLRTETAALAWASWWSGGFVSAASK